MNCSFKFIWWKVRQYEQVCFKNRYIQLMKHSYRNTIGLEKMFDYKSVDVSTPIDFPSIHVWVVALFVKKTRLRWSLKKLVRKNCCESKVPRTPKDLKSNVFFLRIFSYYEHNFLFTSLSNSSNLNLTPKTLGIWRFFLWMFRRL